MASGESSATPLHILVVDDEAAMREVLAVRLEEWGHTVATAFDARTAQEALRRTAVDAVVSDVRLPDASGIELLRSLTAGEPHRPVVLITAYGTVDEAVEAMKLGARDFLTKPLDYAKLRAILAAVAREVAQRRATVDLEAALEHGAGLGPLVGTSPAMHEVYALVRTVAPTATSVLITGESGTGKELVARSVHELSPRGDGPFVALNAAAIPEGLTESELFGHERGAFTGAVSVREGCFELANGGTLFLDEITEMPASLQPKFLRVLEDGRVRRVGGSREIAFDVRVLAATNRDPVEAVAEGLLRRDLYYRLDVFTINMPPLRRRRQDIPLLAQHFVHSHNARHALAVEGLDGEATRLLRAYDWPGNVRELRNVLERAVILAREGWIGPAHLPPYLRAEAAGDEGLVIPADATAAEAERLLILATLDRAGGNKAEAARRLGLDVKTIRNKLRVWREGDDAS
jgi:DNA-binding NtrC family response regulator